MSLGAVRIDGAALQHLALALSVHRGALDKRGAQEPPALKDARHLLIEVIGGRGELLLVGERVPGVPAEGDTGRTGRDALDRDELLSQRDAAEVLGVTPRTVRRAIDRQDLAAESTARGRRVRRGEVDRYAAWRRRHG